MTERATPGEWQSACARLAAAKHEMDLAEVVFDKAEAAWLEAVLECERIERHRLIDGTLHADDKGVVGRCTCGWSTGYRFSSFAASAAFQEHQEMRADGEKAGDSK